jgi:hypothetical protein
MGHAKRRGAAVKQTRIANHMKAEPAAVLDIADIADMVGCKLQQGPDRDVGPDAGRFTGRDGEVEWRWVRHGTGQRISAGG